MENAVPAGWGKIPRPAERPGRHADGARWLKKGKGIKRARNRRAHTSAFRRGKRCFLREFAAEALELL